MIGTARCRYFGEMVRSEDAPYGVRRCASLRFAKNRTAYGVVCFAEVGEESGHAPTYGVGLGC